jgi:hypothetical protein
MADFLARPVVIFDSHVSSTDRSCREARPGEFAVTLASAQCLTDATRLKPCGAKPANVTAVFGPNRMPATFRSAAKSDMPFGH